MLTSTTAVVLNSIQNVMSRTSLGRSTIYAEMSAGRLRSVKVGSRRLIPESALVEFIDSLAAGSTGRNIESRLQELPPATATHSSATASGRRARAPEFGLPVGMRGAATAGVAPA